MRHQVDAAEGFLLAEFFQSGGKHSFLVAGDGEAFHAVEIRSALESRKGEFIDSDFVPSPEEGHQAAVDRVHRSGGDQSVIGRGGKTVSRQPVGRDAPVAETALAPGVVQIEGEIRVFRKVSQFF